MKPTSAFYYIKQNKLRAGIIIFMLVFTCAMYMAGSYIKSIEWYWEKAFEYDDKLVLVSALSDDEDYVQYKSFIEEVKKDPKLTVFSRTARGMGGLDWTCTFGWEMGTSTFVFNSPEDLKAAMARLGITGDFDNIKNHSVVMSSMFAKNKGLKLGDTISHDEISGQEGIDYTVDSIIEDDSFVLFMVHEDSETPLRAYISSDEMEGEELRAYIDNIKGDALVNTSESMRQTLVAQLTPFTSMFIVGCILISVILAVSAGSVITGQYLKRKYEFAVYRAIGFSKRKVFGKCAAEILTMDAIAVGIAAVLLFTGMFLLNELVYIPKGQFLPYYSSIGLGCFLLSNLIVVLPMIIFRGRSMAKADVTEF